MNSASATSAKLGFVFPGQGSQQVGMFGAAALPEVLEAAKEASEVLGEDLVALSENKETLDSTVNAQPALLAAGVGTYRAWLAADGPKPVAMAGHSLGEFAALVCAEALDFATAILLVRERAKAMQAAVPQGAGAMVAVLGLDNEQVAQACDAQEQCWIANINSPSQIVIAGAAADVAVVAQACSDAGAKRVVKLAVTVPSHTPMMVAAQPQFETALDQAKFSDPRILVLHNASCAPAPNSAALRQALVSQLVSPVDWVSLISKLTELCAPEFTLVECGPGKVLTGLNRRIAGTGSCVSLAEAGAMDELLAHAEANL